MTGDDRRGDTFDVVPAALRGAAGTLDSEAEALGSATASLRTHLANNGAPWGTDDVGARFGAAYAPAAETVTNNLFALAGGLERIASALVATANEYEWSDAPLVDPGTAGNGPDDESYSDVNGSVANSGEESVVVGEFDVEGEQ